MTDRPTTSPPELDELRRVLQDLRPSDLAFELANLLGGNHEIYGRHDLGGDFPHLPLLAIYDDTSASEREVWWAATLKLLTGIVSHDVSIDYGINVLMFSQVILRHGPSAEVVRAFQVVAQAGRRGRRSQWHLLALGSLASVASPPLPPYWRDQYESEVDGDPALIPIILDGLARFGLGTALDWLLTLEPSLMQATLVNELPWLVSRYGTELPEALRTAYERLPPDAQFHVWQATDRLSIERPGGMSTTGRLMLGLLKATNSIGLVRNVVFRSLLNDPPETKIRAVAIQLVKCELTYDELISRADEPIGLDLIAEALDWIRRNDAAAADDLSRLAADRLQELEASGASLAYDDPQFWLFSQAAVATDTSSAIHIIRSAAEDLAKEAF